MNQWLKLRNRGTGSNLVDMGRVAVCAEWVYDEATFGTAMDAWLEGHEESLRRTRDDAAGAKLGTSPTDRDTGNMGTLPGLPFPTCSQYVDGQGRARPLGLAGGGVAVVVRGRESRPHGEGRQRVRSIGCVMPGGRR